MAALFNAGSNISPSFLIDRLAIDMREHCQTSCMYINMWRFTFKLGAQHERRTDALVLPLSLSHRCCVQVHWTSYSVRFPSTPAQRLPATDQVQFPQTELVRPFGILREAERLTFVSCLERQLRFADQRQHEQLLDSSSAGERGSKHILLALYRAGRLYVCDEHFLELVKRDIARAGEFDGGNDFIDLFVCVARIQLAH